MSEDGRCRERCEGVFEEGDVTERERKRDGGGSEGFTCIRQCTGPWCCSRTRLGFIASENSSTSLVMCNFCSRVDCGTLYIINLVFMKQKQ